MANRPTGTRDAITCVIPVHNPGPGLEAAVNGWAGTLHRSGRTYEILLVDDGSSDGTAETAAKLAAKLPGFRVLSHESRRGIGACLRTALGEARHALFFYTSIAEPYPSADLAKLLERIEVKDEFLGQAPVLVSGCRAGRPRPLPLLVRGAGAVFRFASRVVLGLPLAASPVWLGTRSTAYSYFVWTIFGVPLIDPNSAFKLWRTDFLRRFPIQSEGDFVHVELVAKATFLTRVLDEIALTPTAPAKTVMRSVWSDFWRLLRNPDFGVPPGVELLASKTPLTRGGSPGITPPASASGSSPHSPV